MTNSERPRRQDRRLSAGSSDSRRLSGRPDRSPRPGLLVALVVLVVVLCVLIALVMRQRDASPAPPNLGPNPRALFEITGPGKGDAPSFVRPLSAAWAPNGDIYVSDTGNHRVCVFNPAGRFIREFGRQKSPRVGGVDASTLDQPAGIVVGPDGNVYVADVSGGAVVVFDPRGKYVRRIRPATEGATRQRRWAPTAVSVSRNLIYATDAAGVAVFSAGGSLKYRFDSTRKGAPFAYPNGIVVRSDGTLVVSDTNNGRVVALEATGSPLWVVGPSEASRRIIGLPRGLAVANDGSVLVADAFLFGIVRISGQGVYMEQYGGRGSSLGQFEFPNDVDVRGDLVVIADKENNRVQVVSWPGLSGGSTK